MYTILVATTVITSNLSIPVFVTGQVLPIGVSLSGMSTFLLLANVACQKPKQLFPRKHNLRKKHNSIKLLVQTKLDSISHAISKAIQNKNNMPAVFHKILKETEKYRKLKEEIQRQNIAKIRQNTKEEREKLLPQRGKEGKEEFLRKIACTPST